MTAKKGDGEETAVTKEWNKRNARCRSSYFGGQENLCVRCDYYTVTGRLRSLICKPGDECTVFMTAEEGEKVYGNRRKLMTKRTRDEISAGFEENKALPDMGDWRIEAWGRGGRCGWTRRG